MILVLSGPSSQSSTLLAQVWRLAKVSGTPWLFTSSSPLSSAYKTQASDSCLRLLAQVMPSALVFDLPNTGNSNAAKTAMMAITRTSSSSVNAQQIRQRFRGRCSSKGMLVIDFWLQASSCASAAHHPCPWLLPAGLGFGGGDLRLRTMMESPTRILPERRTWASTPCRLAALRSPKPLQTPPTLARGAPPA